MSLSTFDNNAVAVVYDHYRTDQNRATYVGPVHSDLSKDSMIVTSVAPKRNGVSFGNRRSSLNLVQSVQVLDTNGLTVTKDMKVEILISLPAGVTEDALKEAVSRVRGVLNANATVVDLFHSGKIEV